jgi:lipid II:glycine glycyltransferase (peptidoglycan interpeptide bridge formation enzyme)
MNLSAKHKAFHDSLMVCSEIEHQIADLEKQIELRRENLKVAEDARDAAASEAAQEKITDNLAAIEMPDGTFRFVQKARRGKKTESLPDGTPPKYPFVVSEKVLRT